MFARLLWCRRRRGAALFETILALAVLAVLATSAMQFLHSMRQKEVIADAGRQVAMLGWAAAHHARTHYGDATDFSLAPAPGADPLQALRDAPDSVLPARFSSHDVMKRALGVWSDPPANWNAAGARARVLAGQTGFDADNDRVADDGWPAAHKALFTGGDGVRLGLVRWTCPAGVSGGAPCLVGPTVVASLAGFRAGEDLDEGAVMALYEITREEFCGDLVMRTADRRPECPDSNELDGVLNMGGNEINMGSGTMTVGTPGAQGLAHEVRVRDSMTAGELRVRDDGGVDVAGKVEVFGVFEVDGALSVYGDVEVEERLDVGGRMDVMGSLDVERRILNPNPQQPCVQGDPRTCIIRTHETMTIKEPAGGLNTDNLTVRDCDLCGNKRY